MAVIISVSKNDLNYNYGLQKNNNLVGDYLIYREKHFKIIQRQFSQLIIFKNHYYSKFALHRWISCIVTMNIGQFVAAEIIILLVINSVEKIILGLETFYDVLTSIEKIGQITDLELEDEIDLKSDVLQQNYIGNRGPKFQIL
jgi:hypothetical protein